MRDAVLVIQQSGARLTVAAVEPKGRIRAVQHRPFGIDRPAEGLAEADAHEVWQVAREGMGAVVQEVGREAIGAVAVVTEPGTALLWAEEHSRPVTQVVMPEDQRAQAVCRSFRERGWDEPFRLRTGRLPTPSAAGFKLSELLAALPRGYSGAADGVLRYGSLASFFVLRLTGSRVHATSRAHALHSLLYNIDQDAWDTELMQVFNVPRACLPEVHPSANHYGETTLGGRLPGPVPIAALGTSLETALYGSLGAEPGATLVHLNASVSLISYVGEKRAHPALPLGETIAVDAHAEPRATIFASVPFDPHRWCIRLGIAADETEALALASRAGDANGLVFVPGEAPADDSDPVLSEYFCGAESDKLDPALLARAVFERGVYQAYEFVEALAAYQEPDPLALTGVFTAVPGLGQRLADLTGRTVHLLADQPHAILGAARLAAQTAGLVEDVESRSAAPESRRLSPHIDPDERTARLNAWRDAVNA